MQPELLYPRRSRFAPIILKEQFAKPLKNIPFLPISVSDSDLNPRNTQSILVVKIFVLLELEQN